jgi:predicted dehydrogenase
MGVVHVEALRRNGVEIAGIVGSSPERGAAAATAMNTTAYRSFEDVLADGAVDVVHLTTPNRLHHAEALAVLAAGKHCVCEKPLAMTSAESRELVAAANASGLVHCTNFNQRFYPLVHQARAVVLSADLGPTVLATGGYLQDWLLEPTDYNWRVDPAEGGGLRAIGDIGSHWIDMLGFVTGLRVESVFAELYTVHPRRTAPTGAVDISTEDAAHVLLRLEGGARASFTVSQVSAGHRNAISFEVNCRTGSVGWNSERTEELWIGHRGRPNEIVPKDLSQMHPSAARFSSYPPGHAEGYPDTFKQLYRAVYAAIEAGGMPAEPDFPTFGDGHLQCVIADAIGASAATGAWTDVAPV